jgi:hypothetical protein
LSLINYDVLNDQVLNLTNELLNSGGSVDNGDQGSANNRWRVDDNWCLIRNGSLNSGPLNFSGRSLNRRRRSLDLSWNRTWDRNLYWHRIGEHDLEHLLDPETDNLCSRCIEVDVTSRLENVCSNRSLGIQQ